MKYVYNIKELDINGHKRMYFCLEEGFETIATFLNSDISGEGSAKFFIDKIKRVLNGEKSNGSASGNSCVLFIKPDFVEIKDKYFYERVSIIETTELILLIETYIYEKKKYKEELDKEYW